MSHGDVTLSPTDLSTAHGSLIVVYVECCTWDVTRRLDDYLAVRAESTRDLQSNRLTGTVPTELGELTAMKFM
ncbi:hypothetical protein CYMTET_17431 [Cymbomonas tetramitiformis]|uniref:Uncharacterized protein n=1 Tax=Cymbomonas tetramitiformis TaxID=36881 RepID=A0AAE0L749_9CHLO|nr:hypothetical protein CYMTET_17431 [Cymbomonas tetramitiformis]